MSGNFKALSDLIINYGMIDWNEYYPEEYVYTATIEDLAAINGDTPGQGQDVIQINSDAPFLWLATAQETYLEAFEDLDPASGPAYAPTGFIPNVRANFLDSGINSYIYQEPIPLRHIGGQSASDRVALVAPRIMGATTNLTFQVYNYSGLVIPRISVSLYGVKAKPRQKSIVELMAERAKSAAAIKSRIGMN